MKRAAVLLVVAAAVLSGCVEDAEVREACVEHGGVNAVNGSRTRLFVACRDGYFRTLR